MANKLLLTLLVNAAVFSALFLLMLAVRRPLGKRISPALQLALRAVIAIKLVVPFGFESSLSLLPAQPVAPADQSDPADTSLYTPAAAQGQAGSVQRTPAQTMPVVAQAPALADQSAHAVNRLKDFVTPANIPLFLLGAWTLGVLAVGGTLYAGTWRTRRLALRARVSAPEHVLHAFAQCKRTLGVRRDVALAMLPSQRAPLVMGPARPVLVLPADVGELNEKSLRHVLLHELAHVKRGDLWVLWLMNALCAVYWFVPTVWLCCKVVRADIETACDLSVLKAIGHGQRLDYISTVLQFAGQPTQSRLAAAMSLSDGRVAMERRVTGMFRSARTGLGGRAAAMLVAVLMLLTGALTACQPTPAKLAVVNKNDGKLEEKLTQTATAATATANTMSDGAVQSTGAPPTLRSRMGIPETWQYEQASDDGAVRLSIDAKIEVPEVAKAAVYKAQVAPFTIEQVKKAHQLLMGGAQLCEPDSVLTREYWQQQIVRVQKEIADAKEAGDTDTQEQFRSSLTYYQERLAKTPETLESTPVEFAFRQEKDSDAQVLHGVAVVNERAMALYSSYTASYTQLGIGLTTDDNPQFPSGCQIRWDLDAPEGVGMTREQARQQAEQWVSQLDPNLQVVSVEPGSDTTEADKSIWMVTFTRTHDGMPSLDYGHYISLENEDINMPGYEEVELGLDDSGFVYLKWVMPLAVTETVNQDAALLPFPEVQDAAAKAAIRYGQGNIKAIQKNPSLKKVTSCSVKVERLALGLTRVAQKDKPGEFLLIPSWDVYGYQEYDGVTQKEGYKAMAYLLTTINALDGSIIDTHKGY